jgi:hypothetical protein
MIIVVAPYPNSENQKDGMIQRVAHIDGLMVETQRVYLDLSFRRFFHKKILTYGNVTTYQLNVITHYLLIRRLIKSANLVYIHSAYNALKVMMFPIKAHIIFDAHGIVPEELTQEGKSLSAKIFAAAERYILKRCNTLVCVTRSMQVHFNAKYGYRTGCEEIVLPILPRIDTKIDVDKILQSQRDIYSVIYAGGMQVWQNIDRMMEAAEKQSSLTYTFLTGFPDEFKSRLRIASLPRFSCKSVPPAQVKDYYLRHQFGFILRDSNLVNAVACPTKLVEYLHWGVVPIVITPHIGDFNEKSLSAVTLEAFEAGIIPDEKTVDQMRRNNNASMLALFASAQSYEERLREIFATTLPGARQRKG